MYTFEITVQRKSGDVWPVVVEQSASGVFLPVRDEGTLRLDLTELASQTMPKEYGLVLGRALFRDEVRDAFVQALTKSEDYLRVLLFVEADDLKTLRWERLCAPLDRGWDFLALTQRAPFCLYLPSLTDRRFPPIGRRDLRALVLVASPDGLERYRLQPFDVMAAVASIRVALGDIPCDVLAKSEGAAGPPTLDALCERITAEHYTLLHVVCHGQFLRETGETALYWATADHRVDPVAGTRFLERLGRLLGARGLPHFAFLATCETARAEAEGALGGVAQRLVRELGMPAVVAMTETVSVTTAQALGTAFYGRLREHGEVDRALVEACAGLAERYDITVPALYSRLGGRPLFSDTPDRPLTHAEIGFGLDRLETLLAERAPVLQEIFQTQATNLRGILGADVTALSVDARREREQALAEVNKLCGEALDLSFDALALGEEPPVYDARCPFRGLYPFRQEDREFFFGREALIERLRQKLAEYPFLPVLGPSGSGKSSLVLAGLLPALQAQEPEHQLAYLTPGADPLTQLEVSLGSVHDGRAVLVVDQFEELFTLCADQDARQTFLGRLLALAEQRRVVLTMRADFWGECAPYYNLKDIMQARQELIAPMDATELRRAMELQASKVGLRFEADLSHTILEDVRGEPGAMPLLQHALLELWKRRHGRWLRAEEYRAVGGVQQAIARTADDLYELLSHGEQDWVRDIFIRLTRLDDDAVPGEARRDTRRRVGLQELVPAAADLASIRALVSRLADSRLVVTSRNEAAGREEVEVAHEALIRYWPRLRRWLDEDRASLRLRETIRQAALEWEAAGREDSLLVHRGSRLRDAEALARHPRITLNALEQAYVDACVVLEEAQHQRELEAARQLAAEAEARRRAEEQARQEAEHRAEEQAISARSLRKWRRVLAVVAILAVAAAGYAFIQQRKAKQQARIATSRQLAAQALVDLDVRAPHNLLLALESIAITQQIDPLSAVAPRQLLNDVLNATGGIPLQHTAPVVAVGFSPDDRWLAAASANIIQLWHMHAPSAAPIPLRGHDKAVNALAFSPDGHTLATVGDDASVRLWDMTAADRTASVRVLSGHSARLVDVAFSRDGRWLATAGEENTARLWNLAAADPTAASSMLPHERSVNTLAFSPDNHWLATGSSDGTVRVWDLLSPNPSAGPIPLSVHADVRKVAFSPNSQWLVAGDTENYTVMLWRLTAPDKPFSLTVDQWALAVAFSPDGRWLATPSQYVARLWDLNKPDPSRDPIVLPGHKNSMSDLAFSPDGQWFVTGSADHTAQLWNMADLIAPPAVLRGHEDVISRVAFSSDGRHLATASRDQTVRLWNVSSPAAEPLAMRTPDGSTKLHMWDMRAVDVPAVPRLLGDELDREAGSVFSPDGQWLVTIPRVASGENVDFVHLWNLSTPSPTRYVVRHAGGIWASPVFSPDGHWLATGGVANPTIMMWDLKAPNPTTSPRVLGRHRGPVRDMAFSADGRRLVTGANDGLALVWDLTASNPSANPRILAGGGGTSIVRTVAISRNSRYVVTGSWEPDYAARIWDLSAPVSSSSTITLPFKGRLFDVAFSPDGRWVAAGSWDFTTQLLDLTKPGAKPFVLQGHTARTLSVAFSPDNRWLATGNEDQTARLWNLTAADPSADSIVLHASYKVGNVSFSPDGRWLALNLTEYRSSPFSPDGQWFASSSTNTRLYHLRWEELIDIACRTAGRNLTEQERRQALGDQPYRTTCRQLP
jgi:WD40 repeat protein